MNDMSKASNLEFEPHNVDIQGSRTNYEHPFRPSRVYVGQRLALALQEIDVSKRLRRVRRGWRLARTSQLSSRHMISSLRSSVLRSTFIFYILSILGRIHLPIYIHTRLLGLAVILGLVDMASVEWTEL